MKIILKYASLAAVVMATTSAQAELQAIDDADMAEVSGQSGIVIEAGFGTIGGVDSTVGDFYDADWSNAGITIEAFKFIVDVGLGWSSEDNTGANTTLEPLQSVLTEQPLAGLIIKDIAIAGRMDMTIDATADFEKIGASGGELSDGDGGIGITFQDSDINIKMGDIGVFVETYEAIGLYGQQVSSFGGVEVLGMDIDGLGLVIRGNGL